MSLSPYIVTVITKEDSPYNVIPNAPIEIRSRLSNGTSGGLSLIYEDQQGLIPITQAGATADANGQFVFYAAAAAYNAVYQSQNIPVDMGLTASTLQAPLDLALINDLSQAYTFKTVALMQASLIVFPVGKKIFWQGYYVESDGGSNWGIVKSGTHTDDGGSIFTLADGQYVAANLTKSISVLKFGAKNDYDYTLNIGDDSYQAIQNAIDYLPAGKVTIPAGHYKSTGVINIFEKNAANGGPQLQFKIDAAGAKIWSTSTGADNALQVNSCKRLTIKGLMIDVVTGVTAPDYNVGVRGMWYSRFVGCDFKSTSFGVGDSGGFNSIYWNKFETCGFAPLTFDASEEPTRHVINANTFENCNINGGLLNSGDYAIYKYGADGINSVLFINCDVSYYNLDVIYIDEPCEGYIEFSGGYFDSGGGIPLDTKGLIISTSGQVQAPQGANLNSLHVEDGSYIRATSNAGARAGGRDPTSGYNLIMNGSLRAAGAAGMTIGNFTLSDVLSNEGYFSQFKNLVSTSDNAFANFTSIPAPFDGYYTLTAVVRADLGVIGTKTTAGGVISFGTLVIGTEWTVTTVTKKMSRGDTFEQSFVNDGAVGQSLRMDIAYIGLNYGSVGNLGLIEHPDADLFNAVQIANGFETISLKPQGSTGLPNSTIFEDTTNGLSFKDKNGVVKTIDLT